MQKYTNTVTDAYGNAVVGAEVEVRLGYTTNPATIYGTDSTAAPLASWPLTDTNGEFYFWAPPGVYNLVITGDSFPTRYWTGIQLYDMSESDAPWFDVKDSAYGAMGDGATDDTAAIQAAIDACEAAGGGTVFFPAGCYRVSSGLTVEANGVVLRGAGRGAEGQTASGTAIAPLSGSAVFGPMITIGTAAAYTYGSGAADIHFASWTGSAQSDATTYLLNAMAKMVNCRECFLRDCRLDFRYADADARIALQIDAVGGAFGSTSNEVTTCHIQSPKKKVAGAVTYGYGVVISNSTGWFNTANAFINCKLYAGGTGAGRMVECRDSSSGIRMTTCQIDTSGDQGIHIGALCSGHFVDCTLDGDGGELLTIDDTARYCFFEGTIDGVYADANTNPNVKATLLVADNRNGPSFPAMNLQPRTAAPYYADAGPTINEGTIYYNSTAQAPYICTTGGQLATATWTQIQLVGGVASGGVYPVDSYGAVPDDGIDDTAAIQAAIDACEAAGVGGQIVFSPGLYRITAGLTITDSNIFLVGAGMSNESAYTNGTTIMVDAGVVANFTMVTFGAAGSQIYGGGMRDIHLWSNNTATLNGGLTLTNVIEAIFENCRIDLRRVDADGRAAVKIDAAAGGNCKLNRFLNCSFQSPKEKPAAADTYGFGVLISNSAGTYNRYNSFDGCWFYNGSAVAAVSGGYCLKTVDAGVGRNFVSNCSFEFGNEQGIYLAGGDGNECLVNCFVDSGNAADDAILIANGAENCYFVGSTVGLIVDSNTEANKAYIVNLADANGPQLKALTIQARSAAPAAPVEGTLYYDAEDHKLYVWTGAAWTDLTV